MLVQFAVCCVVLIEFCSCHSPPDAINIPLKGTWIICNRTKCMPNYLANGADIYSNFAQKELKIDMLQDFNDITYQYVAKDDFYFQYNIVLSRIEKGSHYYVKLNGIIYEFCVYFNTIKLLCEKNSFREYVIPITTNLIKLKRRNTLQIKFVSLIMTAKNEAQRRRDLGMRLPQPECWPSSFQGLCHVNLLRTMQASFAWDWGPAMPVQGFWSIPSLTIVRNNIFIHDTVFIQPFEEIAGCWNLNFKLKVENTLKSLMPTIFCVSAFVEELSTSERSKCFVIKDSSSYYTVNNLFENCKTPILWFPVNTFPNGKPHLYKLVINIFSTPRTTTIKRKFGFRKIVLDQKLIGAVANSSQIIASTFKFIINDKEIFIKGSNLVPLSILPGRTNTSGFMPNSFKFKYLLKHAVDAGMNMLRVWGGGRYLDDEFYQYCDEIGLLIWQDLMFACSLYSSPTIQDPGKSKYEWDSVEKEVKDNVERIQYHPSIAIYATNNENEFYLSQLRRKLNFNTSDLVEYKRLFSDLLSNIVKNVLHIEGAQQTAVPVLISSPSNGVMTDPEYSASIFPQDSRFGDVHFYKYTGNLWDQSVYPLNKFTSEFGIQSVPSPLAWYRSLSKPENLSYWQFNGSLFRHREHQPLGVHYMTESLKTSVGLPSKHKNYFMDFIGWVYLSQLNQAMALKAHISHLMRYNSRLIGVNWPNETKSMKIGHGLSMGALYWQLNDVWAAPTWSTIDAAGILKLSHYVGIKNVFKGSEKFFMSFGVDSNNITLEIVSKMTDIKFEVKCLNAYKFVQSSNSNEITSGLRQSNSSSTLRLFTKDKEEILKQCKCDESFKSKAGCLLDAKVYDISNKKTMGSDFTFILSPKYVRKFLQSNSNQIIIKNIHFHKVLEDEFGKWQEYQVEIFSDSPKFYIYLAIDPMLINYNYQFNRNGFSLLEKPVERFILWLHCSNFIQEDIVENSLLIKHLETA